MARSAVECCWIGFVVEILLLTSRAPRKIIEQLFLDQLLLHIRRVVCRLAVVVLFCCTSMNPADNPADAGPAGPALAAVPNRPPLYTTGLAPKKIKLLRRKCRAPSNLELRNKMRKLDLKQVLQLNGQKFLSSQNKASLVQQVFNLLQEVDRFTEPPLHVSLTMPKPPL